MTEHETPENPPQTGPETPNEHPEIPTAAADAPEQTTWPEQATAPEQTAPEQAAPGYPGIPPAAPEQAAPGNPGIVPAPADPMQTLPGPNTAGYLPGGHQLPTGEPQPTPFDPDRGYAPGPVPAPSPLDPAFAPGPFPEPNPEGFGPNKKLPTGALVGIIAGGIIAVLVLAAVIIIPLANRGGGGGAGGDSPAPKSSTPEEFVEGYLNALAEGDAEAAMTYIDTSSYSTELLTDDVLKASLELGAIDDIEVGKAEEGDYGDIVVSATFTIGGKEVTREFEMYQSEYDGDITMYDGAARVSTYSFDDIGLTVNGVEASDDALVFPGTYEFGTTFEEFAIEGESTLVIADEKSEEALISLRPVLSEEGIATFRELVTASLRECLAMKTLSTPCGMDVTGLEKDGYSAVDGTVARVLTAEGEATLAALEGEVSDRAVVTVYESLSIDITLEGQNAAGERGGFRTFSSGLLTPKIDFAAETPTVVWE